MNQKAQQAYASPPPGVTEPRQVEAWALIRSARDIAEAREALPDNLDPMRAALRANSLLWTVFQDAVLDDSNPLPFEIRQNLLNLSLYVDKRTLECLAGADQDPELLDILVSINQNIAAGLAENRDGADPDAAEPESPPLAGSGNIEA